MTKKILLSGIVGTVVYYLLGWLVYGIILVDQSTGDESVLFIFLGSLFYAFIFAYVFCKLAQISNFKTGFSAGLIIGILYALTWYFFINNEFNLRLLIQEIVIGGLLTAIVAGVIAVINGKLD
ncbi:hypothetical protein N9R44_02500 [Flavobacteriaceae bacterium]|nr:hypothetical protein [Flavobacteriaceae bacterium]